jgi:ABC-type phosphate/phosphonate transport system permease subunit
LVVVLALAVLVYCAVHLGPRVMVLGEGADPFSTIKKFFGAAFVPALVDQSPNMPEGAAPFLVRVWEGLLRTFRYAVVAMSLAVPLGIGLGFFWIFGVVAGECGLWASEAVEAGGAGRAAGLAVVVPGGDRVDAFGT